METSNLVVTSVFSLNMISKYIIDPAVETKAVHMPVRLIPNNSVFVCRLGSECHHTFCRPSPSLGLDVFALWIAGLPLFSLIGRIWPTIGLCYHFLSQGMIIAFSKHKCCSFSRLPSVRSTTMASKIYDLGRWDVGGLAKVDTDSSGRL